MRQSGPAASRSRPIEIEGRELRIVRGFVVLKDLGEACPAFADLRLARVDPAYVLAERARSRGRPVFAEEAVELGGQLARAALTVLRSLLERPEHDAFERWWVFALKVGRRRRRLV